MHPICHELQVSSTDWEWGGGEGGKGPNLTSYLHLRTLEVFRLQKRIGFPLQRGRGERAIIQGPSSPFSAICMPLITLASHTL